MHVVRRKGWEIAERLATPEPIFLNRRGFVAGIAAAGALAASGARALADDADPSAGLYPAARNPAFTLDRDVTPEKFNLTYNNFYEFSTDKQLDASALKTRPWTVKIDGMVEKEQTIDIDDLVKAMGLEERLYRHRCVEAWSMAIPWTGFPLKKLVAFAKPLSSATYVRFETFLDKKMAPGQRSFMPVALCRGPDDGRGDQRSRLHATGAYGKPLAKVQGARSGSRRRGNTGSSRPSRSSDQLRRPASEDLLGGARAREYGFWANVNPDVPHPRWSQASETFLNTGDRRPTMLFNGYGEQVAGLYKGLEKEPLFM